MAQGPVPWTAMNEYAKHYGLDFEETEYLMALIRSMDMVYLNYLEEKRKK